MDCMGKMKDIRNKSYDELCELVEEIKLEDDEFETCDENMMKDVYKWMTGLELEDEVVEVVENKEKECECLYDFKWNHDGFDMLNKNMCCDVCLEVYERGY